MNNYKYNKFLTASSEVSEVLSRIENEVGFIPNVFTTVAESSTALQGLVILNKAFSQSSFNDAEQQIILMAASTTNECIYCVAGHTAFAEKLEIPDDIIYALRNQQEISEVRYNILATTVRLLIQKKGQVSPDVFNNFINAGFSKGQFLELIMGICVKTFTNYVSNSLNIELDDAFKPYAWQRPNISNQSKAQRVA